MCSGHIWLQGGAGPGGAGTHVVDHEVHDGLWHEVTDGLVDYGHVRIHQVANGFHLPLQLRVHGESVLLSSVLVFGLQEGRRGGEVVTVV